MSDRLREALETVNQATQIKLLVESEHEAVRTVMAAARRFLALTETGPDYEAAKERFGRVVVNLDGISEGDIRSIVDAALADYLTEEA